MDGQDPLDRLEHDHAKLSQRVTALRNALAEARQGAADAADTAREFDRALPPLMHDLFEHFAREEEGLFPFIAKELPDLEPVVNALVQAHDRICGTGSRILALSSRGSGTEWLTRATAMFERFDADYAAHAVREAEFLRAVGKRIGKEDRRVLAEFLHGL
jgi:hemerythrin-like domain-containing protein